MTAAWNKALISREQAAELAGAEPVTWHVTAGGLVLRHGCKQSCGLWTPGQVTTPDDVLSAVLRHLVMAHDLPLNHAARDKRESDERAGNRTGGSPGGRGHPGIAAPAAAPGTGGGGGPDDLAAEQGTAGQVGTDT